MVAPPIVLPADLRQRFDGQLDGETIVAWAQFDLDSSNRYCSHFAVLTERNLFVLQDSQAAQAIALSSITEARIVEGLGVDRLRIIGHGRVLTELRYTRRFRRDVTRLHRKLSRRIPDKQGKPPEERPDWLELVERQAEQQELCPKCGQLIPAYAEGVCPQCLQKRKILWRLLDVARPYRAKIWGALALTLVVSGLATLPPIFNKHVMDDAIAKLDLSALWLWIALLACTILASEAFAGLRLRLLAMVGTQVTADLRHMVYAHLHELSLRYFAKRRTGSLITRVTNDTDRLWDFIVFGSVNLVRDITMIGFFAIVMFWLNWVLAIIALAPLPLLGALTYYRGMKMQRLFGRLWTYWSRMTAVVGDAVPGIRVVKAFANEQREIERFDRRSDEYTAKEQEIHVIWTQLQPAVSALMRFGALLIWAVGGYLVIRNGNTGKYTLGTLVAFTQFVWQFYQPIMELANSNRMVTRAASSAQRVFEVLDTPPEIYSRIGAVRKDRLEGRVEFRNVSFSYEGAQPALRDVSVVVEPGQMIGLCGPSGAGKSTFVNLLCRFYDVTDGQILIDGIDIRDYDVKWLRRQIGMVLQEPYLFHGTIADNIRYGNPQASEAEIIRAAKAANAHDFIVGFPDGYDTMVGERGQSLSGGERQRISIARAILHNPRLLILDEATSSVDTETEKQIQQALDRLVEGRTTIAIAHRLSTLQAADRLLVLEKGRIVEQGRHEELVNKPDGVYAKLHKTQMEMASMVAIR
ncbi:ABC transporter ATP-binding protein [Fontivita pretiosa]|uniref:ABC transporter ATP-binding protein n=1 Tax=Fontivita pretiosa TaxID=2989684 RepID=UPI003D179B0F